MNIALLIWTSGCIRKRREFRGGSASAQPRSPRAHAAHAPSAGVCVHVGLHLAHTCTSARMQSKLLLRLVFLVPCTRCTNGRVQCLQIPCTWSRVQCLALAGRRSEAHEPLMRRRAGPCERSLGLRDPTYRPAQSSGTGRRPGIVEPPAVGSSAPPTQWKSVT